MFGAASTPTIGRSGRNCTWTSCRFCHNRATVSKHEFTVARQRRQWGSLSLSQRRDERHGPSDAHRNSRDFPHMRWHQSCFFIGTMTRMLLILAVFSLVACSASNLPEGNESEQRGPDAAISGGKDDITARPCSENPDCDVSYTEWEDWGSCSTDCGEGSQVRTRQCLGQDNVEVDCARCGGECSQERDCSSEVACTFRYTEWSVGKDCVQFERERTRECERSDGQVVACERCGGECVDSSPCCDIDFNVVDCSPEIPGDPNTCNSSLDNREAQCRAHGCSWSGPNACSIGGSSSMSDCYGARARCF